LLALDADSLCREGVARRKSSASIAEQLGTHDVFTVRFKGWAGLRNGELLKTAEENGFEVFITGDQTIFYEQNLSGRRVAMVVLSSIDWRILKDNL
jgi:hypothetical protein